LFAAGQAHHGPCVKAEPGAEGKILDHAGHRDMPGGCLVHRPGDDIRGRAGDAPGGELEFPRVRRQPHGRLLPHQGERAFHRADRAVEGIDDTAVAGGRPSPESLDHAELGRVQHTVGGQQDRQERGRPG
jgi:hypothetical protein